MLKQNADGSFNFKGIPAAFRRLCVETDVDVLIQRAVDQPPLGGCVLKLNHISSRVGVISPAAFRRLCVETRPSH